MIIHLITELIKKISLYKNSYFQEPYTYRIKVELDLYNYAIKFDLKSVDPSKFAEKADLASLKSYIY